jgi:Zn-dependent protease
MLKQKELTAVLVASLVLALVATVRSLASPQGFLTFIYTLVSIIIIILLNIFAKKMTASYYQSEIETRIWKIKRYGFKPRKYFKSPFLAGVFVPLALGILTLGNLIWMAVLVFDVKPKVSRAARRHSYYTFSAMTEWHLALIAASGIAINLVLAVIGYLINQPEFAKLNIFYAFFNLLPISDLDGNKIFFGGLVLWSFLAIVTLIALSYVFLLV